MTRDEHSPALFGEAAQQPAQPAHPGRIESVRGLVEHEQIGVPEKRCGKAEPLPRPEGIGPHPPVGAFCELDQLEHLIDALGRDLGGEREGPQMIAAGPSGVEVVRLEQRPGPPGRLVEIAVAATEDECLTTGWLSKPKQNGDHNGDPVERLEAVLETYALISHEHRGTELAAVLHQGEHVVRAQRHLSDFIERLLTEGAETGELRRDVGPSELASYSLHALAAASSPPSKAAVRRLVMVTVAGLRRAEPGRSPDGNDQEAVHAPDPE